MATKKATARSGSTTKTTKRAPGAGTSARKKAKGKRSVPPIRRRDGAGHLDPRYAADLLAASLAGRDEPGDNAFVRGTRAKDDLAEVLGEEVVEAMTSGEDEGE